MCSKKLKAWGTQEKSMQGFSGESLYKRIRDCNVNKRLTCKLKDNRHNGCTTWFTQDLEMQVCVNWSLCLVGTKDNSCPQQLQKIGRRNCFKPLNRITYQCFDTAIANASTKLLKAHRRGYSVLKDNSMVWADDLKAAKGSNHNMNLHWIKTTENVLSIITTLLCFVPSLRKLYNFLPNDVNAEVPNF